MSASFRWGLVGYGDLAEKRVVQALRATGTLAAVWGRNPGRTTDFARRHEIARPCRTLDELVGLDLDAVYVCTPPEAHSEHASRALEAGRHVLVEKPMAARAEECDWLIDLAKKHGVKLGVAYFRRAFPKMIRIRELIGQEMLGVPVWANIAAHSWYAPATDDPKHWRVEKARSGAGALADIGVHRLDLLNYWLGESRLVHTEFTRLVHDYEVEDGSSLVLRLANGAPVHAYFSWNSKTWMDRFEIVGSEGKIIADPLDGPQLTLIRGREREEISLPAPENAHLPCVADFVEACRTNRAPLCDGMAGRQVNVLLEQAIEMAQS